MITRMLIDARHREETRVAVIKGNRIEEFDFESAEHKQLKGNIYLAKVTRVEPSLQAAFVEYGGNRHGFLAFSEIHPDYYQIPKEDREALLREEAEQAAAQAAMRAEEDMDSLEGDIEDMRPPAALDDDGYDDDDAEEPVEIGSERDREDAEDDDNGEDGDDDTQDGGQEDGNAESGSDGDASEGRGGDRGRGRGRGRRRGRGKDRGERSERDEATDFRRSLHRRYKIQDVIKRRQVMLVQVVKEERGTKGAALTTYLSLAGRYCVLMPNSSHGGGISRKISNGADRKRLKSVIDELGLPSTMGCIVRTAGLERTKTEIKRDFDYLARLWDEIREKTLGSAAPALIHSDSDLIKRAIRDIYNSDIEEVLIEGDEGYRAGKDFMKLLMPSHARRVKQYSDPVSLFQRYGVEDQLGAMYQPVVPLKSGGYLVINPTEALVSIDINSGRSTREHNIEQTAYATNLEAAYEIARQLRLRDMAGLVVIDFIDMEVGSNVRKVERAMRDALKNDRARIQVGRISGFGLMEMSRQRLRTGVLEASTRACPHCEGTGLVRTASSAGLSALRLLEEEAARGRGSRLTLRASQEAAFYVLNNKRAELSEIEARYGVRIDVQSDGQTEGARMAVEASGPPPANLPRYETVIDEDDDLPVDAQGDDDAIESERDEEDRNDRSRRKRGRRRRGRRDGEARDDQPRNAERDADGEGATDESESEDGRDSADEDNDGAGEAGTEGGARRRRRGRRGGRGRRNASGAPMGEQAEGSDGEDGATSEESPVIAHSSEPDAGDTAPEAAAPAKRRRRKSASEAVTEAEGEAVAVVTPAADASDTEAEAKPAKPKRASRAKAKPVAEAAPEAELAATDDTPTAETEASGETASKAKRPSRPRKASAKAAEAAAEPVVESAASETAAVAELAEPVGADGASNGDGDSDGNDSASPRRGWWQRTFGA